MKGIRYQLTRDSNMESVLRFCNYGNCSFRTPCHFPVILSHLFQYPGCQKWPFPYLFDKKNSLLVFIESAAPKGPRLDTISCVQINFGTNIAVVGDSKSFSCSSHVIFCTFVPSFLDRDEDKVRTLHVTLIDKEKADSGIELPLSE
jgi:hypothetical protein